ISAKRTADRRGAPNVAASRGACAVMRPIRFGCARATARLRVARRARTAAPVWSLASAPCRVRRDGDVQSDTHCSVSADSIRRGKRKGGERRETRDSHRHGSLSPRCCPPSVDEMAAARYLEGGGTAWRGPKRPRRCVDGEMDRATEFVPACEYD